MTIRVGLYGQRVSKPTLGKLAAAIADGIRTDDKFVLSLLETDDEPTELDAIVYAKRNDDRLVEALTLADQLNATVYLLSTSMEESLAAIPHKISVHMLPNTSREVLEYIDNVIAFNQAHPSWSIDITEYHQQSKSDVSGTALSIAAQIGVESDAIRSVRNDAQATQLFDIAPAHLSGYAVHQITFTNPDTHTQRLFQIVVTGHQTYVDGLKQIILDQQLFS